MNDIDYAINFEVLKLEIIDDVEVVESSEDESRFHVIVSLPMSYGWYDDVTMVVEKNSETRYFPLEYSRSLGKAAIFEGIIDLETSAIIYYYFTSRINGEFNYIKSDKTFDNRSIAIEDKTKLSVNFEVPDYAKGALMYHVFVDRFYKGRRGRIPKMPRRTIHRKWDEEMAVGPNDEGIWNADFYGGDLKGIKSKLDYLISLGVDIIYLSPIVRSQSNHRYDTANYMEVDPYAGSEEDLKNLCDAAHEKGMKVILDAVFNHTGNDSIYFNELGTYDSVGAYNNPDSPYADFYRKHYIDGKEEYEYWWGMKNLPVCDGDSFAWKNYITGVGGVIDHWFSLGIDGLRLDVADELTDEFIELIRSAVKRNKEDGFILGEVWKNPMRMGRDYISSGKGMDSVMDYPLIDALIRYIKYKDVDKLYDVITQIKHEYPEDTIKTLMNFTSTHDISRIMTIFGSREFRMDSEWVWDTKSGDNVIDSGFCLSEDEYNYGKKLYEVYLFILTFFPGILSIFYGDEVGVQGLGNLANRKSFPWGNVDRELLRYFRYIGLIRKNEKFLKEADLNIIDINKKYMMFERKLNDEGILVTVNNTGEEQTFNLPHEYTKMPSGIYTLKKSKPKILTPYGAVAIKK